MITDRSDRLKILDLAREAVLAAAGGETLPDIPGDAIFQSNGGAFVTLKKIGHLRGCIGHFTGTGCLGRTIVEMAASAAISDPRFPPVMPDEVKSIEISISLLSPMKPARPEEVVPGIHGVYIRSRFGSGTLLPQVALEEGWDRETFLRHSCLKAGLPPDSWNDDNVGIFTYTAEVFGDETEGAESE